LGSQGNNADLSLFSPRLHTAGVEIHLRSFLPLALDGGNWSTARSGCFFPEKKPWKPLSSWLIGPHSRFGRFGEEKNILLLRKYEPRIIQPVA